MNPKVDAYIGKAKKWRKEYETLRAIVLRSGLTEELKWGVPCYTFEKSNVVLIHGFKEYCAILFVKGSLLKDPKGILIQQTENVQAGRQVRFANLQEIERLERTLEDYLREAIEVEKAGLKVDFKKTSDFVIPVELQTQPVRRGWRNTRSRFSPARGWAIGRSSARTATGRPAVEAPDAPRTTITWSGDAQTKALKPRTRRARPNQQTRSAGER